jgi:hypothetical protein
LPVMLKNVPLASSDFLHSWIFLSCMFMEMLVAHGCSIFAPYFTYFIN